MIAASFANKGSTGLGSTRASFMETNSEIGANDEIGSKIHDLTSSTEVVATAMKRSREVMLSEMALAYSAACSENATMSLERELIENQIAMLSLKLNCAARVKSFRPASHPFVCQERQGVLADWALICGDFSISDSDNLCGVKFLRGHSDGHDPWEASWLLTLEGAQAMVAAKMAKLFAQAAVLNHRQQLLKAHRDAIEVALGQLSSSQ
jgi:hypothetical protein